jgi:uncharacterized protein
MISNQIVSKMVREAFDPKRLHLIILPTEKCNFRCFYCYEDFKIGRMSSTIVQSVKELLNRRASTLKQLEISWFGGEPLLAKDIVLEISNHAHFLSSKHNFTFESNITTNGFFVDDQTLNDLFSAKVRHFQISLDGDKEEHNKTRTLANGSGSFDRIWSNLLGIKFSQLEVKILLRVHFGLSEYKKIVPLIQKINDSFASDKRFEVFFKSIEKLGSQNDKLLPTLSSIEKEKIKTHLKGILKGTVEVSFDKEPYVCYASKPNSLVIRANGQLSKCTVAFNDDINDVGRIDKNGCLKINQENLKKWAIGFKDMNLKSLACPLSILKKQS